MLNNNNKKNLLPKYTNCNSTCKGTCTFYFINLENLHTICLNDTQKKKNCTEEAQNTSLLNKTTLPTKLQALIYLFFLNFFRTN